MKRATRSGYDIEALLSAVRCEKKIIRYKKKEVVFSQGDLSTALFFIESGALKLSMVSAEGNEVIICLTDGGSLFGESCISAGQPLRFHSAVALNDVRLVKIDRSVILRLLSKGGESAVEFVSFLLKQNARVQEDLANRIVGSAEQNLARVILSVANLQGRLRDRVLPLISQQTIAEMMGITRQRVNALMKQSKLTSSSTRSKKQVHLPDRGTFSKVAASPFVRGRENG